MENSVLEEFVRILKKLSCTGQDYGYKVELITELYGKNEQGFVIG